MEDVYNEISGMFRIFITNPFLGVETIVENVPTAIEDQTVQRAMDDIEIVEADYSSQSNASAAYYVAEQPSSGDIIFSHELGLAIEQPPGNCTLEQLWKLT